MGAVAAVMMAQKIASLSVVTWNPSDKGANISLGAANLQAQKVTSDAFQSVRATHGHSATDAGGFYFEVQLTGGGGAGNFALVGVGTASDPAVASQFAGQGASSYGYYQQTGEKYTNNVASAFGATYTTNDVIGVLVKNGKVYFSKNNTWQNSGNPAAETGFAYSGLTGTVYPVFSPYRALVSPHIGVARFKASDFTGTLPTGASAWGI